MAVFSSIATALGFGAAGTASAGAAGATAAGAGIGTFGKIATAVTLGTGVIGTGTQIIGQLKADKAQKRAEDLRKAQMELESRRSIRASVREAQIKRAQALNAATAQGAGEGSGIAGGIGSITAEAGRNVVGTRQATQLGRGIFDANKDVYSGQTLSSIGSGIQSIGNNIARNFQTYDRLSEFYSF